MRSLKIERAQRPNPRAQAGRKPARAARKPAAQPAARRDEEAATIFSRVLRRLRAFATRPMLTLTGGLVSFALIAALLAGGK